MLASTEVGNIEAVREHTSELIQSASLSDAPVLVEAPPNSGKTTNAIELAFHTDTPVTYLARRIDLYEQAENLAEELAEEHDDEIRYERIPAPHRTCPTFKGENEGSVSTVERLYAKGYSGREIHRKFPDKTPCGDTCEYLEVLKKLDDEIESIDLLIGHHSHCNRHQYVRNRIVLIDEFNPGPFLRPFPDDSSNVIDSPAEIIPEFLRTVSGADDWFLGDAYQDVTDLLQGRTAFAEWAAALNWFKENGADRREAQRFDFLEPTADEYDKVHAYAPFLTFSLLCMERLGPGIEVAPAPSGWFDEIWQEAGLGPATKCLRDRNSGTMYVLDPPDLTPAAQVIGLDGTPTVELWNLLFAPEEGFKHEQVIDRDDFTTYLRSAMNMELVQIGGGMHPYAGGNISDLDEERFAAIQAMEGERFAIVSTKKALETYQEWGVLDRFVRQSDTQPSEEENENRISDQHQALHYAIVKSSNEFETESLGVVAGMPFPSDDLVRIWAGFCGEAVEVAGNDDDELTKSFGEFGDRIYRHFAHNQVVQAILRFGRDESVYENEGATVYVSTHALPDWFDVDIELNVQSKEKQSVLLTKLFEIQKSENKPRMAFRTVIQLHDMIESDETLPDVSEKGIRNALERLTDNDYILVEEDGGKHFADIYRMTQDARLIGDENEVSFLRIGDDLHALDFDQE